MAQTGMARAIHPVHTPLDGDVVFAVSTGRKPLADPVLGLTVLGSLAADCLARAVARGVYEATALPFPDALPAWRDLFGRGEAAHMSRGRLIFVGCTTAALLVLAGWQLQREWLIRDCLDAGGVWDGSDLRPAQGTPDPAARPAPVVRARVTNVRTPPKS